MTAPQDEPDLVALLGSRLCHDLASPMSALSNGLELMEDAEGAASPEMRLLRDTLDTTLARLRFFRLAFGGGGTVDGTVPAREAAEIVTAMYRDGRRGVEWLDAEDRLRSEVRLAYLALNCIERATPWAVRIAVGRDGAAWAIEARADRFKAMPDRWAALAERRVPGDLRGDEVQFGILARAAREADRPVGVEIEAGRLTVTV